MRRLISSLILLVILIALVFIPKTNAPAQAATSTPIQIYGAWHCGNDACTWATVRDMTNFDYNNHWLIDRGDGSGQPSVNLVVLSFVNPLKLRSEERRVGKVRG